MHSGEFCEICEKRGELAVLRAKIGRLGCFAPFGRPIWEAPRTFGALLVGAALRSAPLLALVALRAPVLSMCSFVLSS